jgi:hypothetical protein
VKRNRSSTAEWTATVEKLATDRTTEEAEAGVMGERVAAKSLRNSARALSSE